MGNRVKFTGGEPTLNPHLLKILRFTKSIGYSVFLDTNGSRPETMGQILGERLVDVVGLSIKGVDKRSAMDVTGVDASLCWTLPLQTMRLVADSGTTLLVTYVLNDHTAVHDLSRLSDLVPSSDNVFLKFNNLMDDRSDIARAKPLSQQSFDKLIDDFITEHPEWTGRVIRISSTSCVTDRDRIGFS